MAQFKVLEVSYIDNKICQPGDVVEYAGFPSENLEPLDAPAKRLAAQTPSHEVTAKRLTKAGFQSPLEALAPSDK